MALHIKAHTCGDCGNEWESVWVIALCPVCKSRNVTRVTKSEPNDGQEGPDEETNRNAAALAGIYGPDE